MNHQIWIVSELYYPEETSTGYLLTQIAEGLADEYKVRVVCAQPTYAARGTHAPSQENRRGVDIYRCGGTTFDKNIFTLRLINVVSISITIFWTLLAKIHRSDKVLVVTNPPLLPFLTLLACRLRGAKCVLLVHDVYPEVLIATGFIGSHSLFARMLAWVNRWLYGNMERIVVLGRDMRTLVQDKIPERKTDIVVIPNWADLELVAPAPRSQNSLLGQLNLQDKFIIQYAGNMGRTHGLEKIVHCSRILQNNMPEVHFLFIGSGAKRKWLEEAVVQTNIENVAILSSRPRNDQPTFLNACDVAIISFVSGMAGVSVPSRMYNIMAAGKPIIAVADSWSELALVVQEEQIGWVVAPDATPDELAKVIIEAHSDPQRLTVMGERARHAAEARYSLARAIQGYSDLFGSHPHATN